MVSKEAPQTRSALVVPVALAYTRLEIGLGVVVGAAQLNAWNLDNRCHSEVPAPAEVPERHALLRGALNGMHMHELLNNYSLMKKQNKKETCPVRVG